jgi:hypothetical protein
MGYESASAPERLLLENVALCWCHYHIMEQLYAQNTGRHGAYDVRLVEHFERRLSASHRRYLQALETLARVRRLEVMIQVSIGGQQLIQG